LRGFTEVHHLNPNYLTDMDIFADTADIEEIKKLNDLGIIDGVTTNPTLIAKSGRDLREVLGEICDVVRGPVSGETVSTDAEGMIREGRWLREIDDTYMVVKVPLTAEGIKACYHLSQEGHPVNVTLCFSANQALLAAIHISSVAMPTSQGRPWPP